MDRHTAAHIRGSLHLRHSHLAQPEAFERRAGACNRCWIGENRNRLIDGNQRLPLDLLNQLLILVRR